MAETFDFEPHDKGPFTRALLQLYNELCGLTLNHDVINDRACVTVDRLEKILIPVNSLWYLNRTADAKKHENDKRLNEF